DVVRTDVLRNAARVAGSDSRAADIVEQRRLAVVDVAHDRDDRRTRNRLRIGRRLDGLEQLILDPGFLERLRRMAELLDDERRRVLIYDLVDRDHHAHLHQGLDDLGPLHGHALSKLADGDRARDLDLADDGRGRPREAVLRVDVDLHRAAPIGLLLLAPAADPGRNVQRVIGGLATASGRRRRRRRGTRTLRFTLLRQALALLGRALLLLGKARRLLGRAPGFFLRPLTRFRVLLGSLPFRGFALARLALGGLAGLRLAASRLLGLAALPLGTLLGG